MRVLTWHGWLLEGSGSNVYTARVAEVLRAEGHDVLLMCQEAHPERYPWIDAWGGVGADGVSGLTANASEAGSGRCVLLRPEIGTLLPVFVFDEYEGFDVKTFVDLSDEELDLYLERNVEALRVAAAWHASEVVVVGHAIPGATVAKRALGPGRFEARIHGSDLEYAIRRQVRYRDLAREGLGAARVVVGASEEVLRRCRELVPGVGETVVVPPGVDRAFRPRPRSESLFETAELLEADPATARGRPASLDEEVERALDRRDAEALDALARTYDQEVPDPGAGARIRDLSDRQPAPIVGYLGKFIPQKGVELFLTAAHLSALEPVTLVVGFGLYREWLTALTIALRRADAEALDWLHRVGQMPVSPEDLEGSARSTRVTFTGRLDHRYAPGVVAAIDVLVVPSILPEAFGMVTAEGAAAGALPLVARHSGLAEVAGELEGAVGRPGLFSFDRGAGVRGIADGMDRLLSLSPEERDELRREISSFVTREFSWRRTAARLMEAGRST